MIQLDYKLCMAAGQDAGNRSMRAAGRTEWSIEDAEAANEEASRLLITLPDAWRWFSPEELAAAKS